MFRDKAKDGTTRLTGGGGKEAWPVNSIYISMVATNPGPLLGGTWSRFAVGRMLVGVNEGDALWDFEGKTGGNRTHTITTSEMPSHNHDISHDHAAALANSAGSHTHAARRKNATGGAVGVAIGSGTDASDLVTDASGDHSHVVDIPPFFASGGFSGAGNSGDFLPPFVAVYMWRRTA